ncbi:MAG: ABC transporter substrate-binding protein [bacterium]
MDRYNLANQLYHEGKYERAARLYTTLLLHDPQHPLADQAIFHMGMIYLSQGNYQRSFFQFEKLIQNHPQSMHYWEAKLGQARCYSHLQSYPEAIALFQECLNHSPGEQKPEVITYLADTYLAMRDYQKAYNMYILLYQMAPLEKQNPEILHKVSLCQIHLGYYDQAIMNMNQLLRIEYGSIHQAEIHQSFATLYLMRNQPFEAVHHFLESRRYAEKEEIIIQGEQEIAKIIQDQLTMEELQSVAEKYRKRYPADLALIELGYSFQRDLKFRNAKQAWEQFLDDFPGHSDEKKIRYALKDLELKLSSANQNRLGCIIPVSGDLSIYGDKVVKGIKLALEQHNLRTGSHVELVIVDSKGNPEYAKDGLKLLIEKEEVMAIIGPLLSSVAYAVAPLVNELGICMITPTATGENIPESGPFFFRNCLTNQQQGKALAEYAVDALSLKRFGILYPYNPYGNELMKIFAGEIERRGGKVEIIEFYEEGDTDFRHQLERINQVRPEGLFIPGYPEEVVLIAPQVPFYEIEDESGQKPKGEEDHILSPVEEEYGIQLLGCDGWYSERVILHGGEYVEGTVFTSGFFKEDTAPQVRQFVYNYQKKYGSVPDLLSAQAYDATNIILEALMRCEDAGREGLRESLSKTMGFQGVTGVTSFAPSGEAVKEVPILSIQNHQFMRIK